MLITFFSQGESLKTQTKSVTVEFGSLFSEQPMSPMLIKEFALTNDIDISRSRFLYILALLAQQITNYMTKMSKR